jgi:hypothetical protein
LVSPAGICELSTPCSVDIPFRKVTVPRKREPTCPSSILFFPSSTYHDADIVWLARSRAPPARPFPGGRTDATVAAALPESGLATGAAPNEAAIADHLPFDEVTPAPGTPVIPALPLRQAVASSEEVFMARFGSWNTTSARHSTASRTRKIDSPLFKSKQAVSGISSKRWSRHCLVSSPWKLDSPRRSASCYRITRLRNPSSGLPALGVRS